MASGVVKRGVSSNAWHRAAFGNIVFLFVFVGSVHAADGSAVQRNAMATARAGNITQAIRSLKTLHKQHPEDLSIQRDLLVVYGMAGNCPAVERLYKKLGKDIASDRDALTRSAECLLEDGFFLRAVALLTPASRKYPNDRAIQDAYVRARAGANRKRWFNYNGAEVSSSDAGSSKQALESEIFRSVSDYTTVYARLNLAQEVEPVLADGRLRRLGVGVDNKIIGGTTLRGEVSGSFEGEVDSGVLVSASFAHSDKLVLSAGYTSYAEDIPMPAIGAGIRANRSEVAAGFHTAGWVYEGTVTARQYHFSDNNDRQTLAADLSYAYHRDTDRWRRYGLAIGHEQNSLTGVPYFNPTEANTVVLYHSWELPRQSRFKKTSDKLTVKVGLFAQSGYASEYISELAYERKHVLTDHSWLEMGGSIASNVYDGVRESQAMLRISYAREF